MSVYRVRGPLRYREHEPGETFEAVLEPDVEERALRHGTIEVLERSDPGIQPGSVTLPDGWQAAQPRPTQEV
jgi:hypothetical protein